MNNDNNEIMVDSQPVQGVGPVADTVVSTEVPAITPNTVSNEVADTLSSNNSVITPMGGITPDNSDTVVPNVSGNTDAITPQASGIISTSSEVATPNTGVNSPNSPVQGNENALSFDLPSSNSIVDQSVNSNGIETNPMNGANTNINSNINNSITPSSGDATQVISPAPTVTSDQSTVDNNIPTNNAVVSVGKFLGYLFLFSIPVVGFIMLIVKALDKKDKNISNFAKAQLLYGVIISVIVTVFVAISFTALVGVINNIAGNSVQSNGDSSYLETTDDYYNITDYVDSNINSNSSIDDANDVVSSDASFNN